MRWRATVHAGSARPGSIVCDTLAGPRELADFREFPISWHPGSPPPRSIQRAYVVENHGKNVGRTEDCRRARNPRPHAIYGPLVAAAAYLFWRCDSAPIANGFPFFGVVRAPRPLGADSGMDLTASTPIAECIAGQKVLFQGQQWHPGHLAPIHAWI